MCFMPCCNHNIVMILPYRSVRAMGCWFSVVLSIFGLEAVKPWNGCSSVLGLLLGACYAVLL